MGPKEAINWQNALTRATGRVQLHTHISPILIRNLDYYLYSQLIEECTKPGALLPLGCFERRFLEEILTFLCTCGVSDVNSIKIGPFVWGGCIPVPYLSSTVRIKIIENCTVLRLGGATSNHVVPGTAPPPGAIKGNSALNTR